MNLIELNTNPSRKDLAWFGLILLAVGGVVGMLVWRATGSLIPPFSIWIASSVLTATYYVVPGLRRPMFLAWMYVTYPVGWVVSHTLLAVLYFGLLTVIGRLMRAFGYDPMQRTFDRSAPSYWVERPRHTDVTRYFRQF